MNRTEVPRGAETVVIGGGVVGLRLGWLLAEHGVDVAVLDDGLHSGSTANAGSLHVQMQSRFMRLYPDMVPAVEASLPLYVRAVEEWERVSGQVEKPIGYDLTGGLMVAENTEQLDFLAAKCARERELGLDSEMVDRAKLDTDASYLGPAVIGAELCHHEGKINPLLANSAIRDAALSAGAKCHDGVTVKHIVRRGADWELGVGSRTVLARRIVIAAGARSGHLVEQLGIALPLRAEPLHMNITAAVEPMIGHLVQHADRMITLKQFATGHVVIGGGWPAEIGGPDQPPEVLRASLIGNVGLAAHIVPTLGSLDIIRTWAGINPTADGLSVLGAAPDHPGLYFAVGGDAGYTLGPMVARLVCDAITGRQPEFDLAPYTVTRFAR